MMASAGTSDGSCAIRSAVLSMLAVMAWNLVSPSARTHQPESLVLLSAFPPSECLQSCRYGEPDAHGPKHIGHRTGEDQKQHPKNDQEHAHRAIDRTPGAADQCSRRHRCAHPELTVGPPAPMVGGHRFIPCESGRKDRLQALGSPVRPPAYLHAFAKVPAELGFHLVGERLVLNKYINLIVAEQT